MELKYELLETKEVLGVIETSFKQVETKDILTATHIHKCRHDEGLPCTREVIKK